MGALVLAGEGLPPLVDWSPEHYHRARERALDLGTEGVGDLRVRELLPPWLRMRTDAGGFAPPIYCLTPPYTDFEPVRDPTALRGDGFALGTVLVVGVESADDWPVAAEWVPRLRSQVPGAPVVLRLRRGALPEPDVIGREAAQLHVRAVLYDDQPPREALRFTLTDPATLPEAVDEWLSVRGIVAPAPIRRLIGEIFRQAPTQPRLRGLLRTLGQPERTVRSWFHRAGLPGPGSWLAAAHAVYAALRLQRERQTPLLTIAVECGYSDHSSLSRQALRLFGARPGQIRQTLGWEGLLDRWLARGGGIEAGQRGRRSAEQLRDGAGIEARSERPLS